MAILAQHLIRDFPEYYGCFQTKYFTYQRPPLPQPQPPAVRLQGHRRHQDRLHQGRRLQPHRFGQRDDKHLVAVVLGGRTGSQRDAAMRSLLDKYFPKAVAGRAQLSNGAAGC